MVDEVALSTSEILRRAAEWQDRGHSVSLATVIGTWGSSPRPVGSVLATNERREFVGSVSGGCIENEVIEAAQKVLQTGRMLKLAFGVSNERAWEVGLACGGRIEIYIERLE
jgi:xanthine/CO dehydrogenase XdhC/CoxF family maturation factor